MQYETIELIVDGPIATLRLNRPQRLNAFSRQLVGEVEHALDALAADDTVRVVILCGAGRCFSSGYDIAGDGSRPETVADWKSRMDENQFAQKVWNFRKPIIAQVHSYCLAGACEIALLCDFTIASEDAVFGEPDIRFATGSPPAAAFAFAVPMKVARELIYTGSNIDARRAYQVGMVNEVVPLEELESRARQYALLLSKVAPLALQTAKEALNRAYEMQGIWSAILNNNNLVAILDGSETEEGRTFSRIRSEQGLKAALAWREAQFREAGQNA
jgi:enoyl-CoA hydratase/carnithine racemase